MAPSWLNVRWDVLLFPMLPTSKEGRKETESGGGGRKAADLDPRAPRGLAEGGRPSRSHVFTFLRLFGFLIW